METVVTNLFGLASVAIGYVVLFFVIGIAIGYYAARTVYLDKIRELKDSIESQKQEAKWLLEIKSNAYDDINKKYIEYASAYKILSDKYMSATDQLLALKYSDL